VSNCQSGSPCTGRVSRSTRLAAADVIQISRVPQAIIYSVFRRSFDGRHHRRLSDAVFVEAFPYPVVRPLADDVTIVQHGSRDEFVLPVSVRAPGRRGGASRLGTDPPRPAASERRAVELRFRFRTSSGRQGGLGM